MHEDKYPHPLVYPESFPLREPVLDALSSLEGRWRLTSDGKHIEVSPSLGNLSQHERAIVEFAINPFVTAPNIFAGLDSPVRAALATAIARFFCEGGPGNQ